MSFKRLFQLAMTSTTLLFSHAVHADQSYAMNDCCNACGEFIAFGDFLYWEAAQDQMQYAGIIPGGLGQLIKGSVGNSGVHVSDSFDIKEPGFQYKPGFRIGVGYITPCTEWDMVLSWTRLHEKINSTVSDTGSGIIPISDPAALIIDIASNSNFKGLFSNVATSHWDFQFDTIDFQLGKNYCLTPCVNLHSYLGVKGALIRQKQCVNYFGLTAAGQPLTVNSAKKNNFYGVGPVFGIDTSWTFFQDFNLYSAISAGLLYGQFCVSNTPTFQQTNNSIVLVMQADKKKRVRPTVDALISLDWSSCLWDNFVVDIGIGYEVQYWWNQWQVPASFLSSLVNNGTSSQGDLVLQGLTVHFGFKF